MTKVRLSLAAACLTGAMVLATAIPVTPANAAGFSDASDTQLIKRSVRFAGELRTQTQKMATEALLITLGVESDEVSEGLEASRTFFRRVLHGLREGDGEIGLPVTRDEEILSKLRAVEQIWLKFDKVLTAGVEARKLTPEQVVTFAELNDTLLELTDEVAEAYEEEISTGIFSMFLIATEMAEYQTLLIQKMSKEVLLIAHGHEVEESRQELRDTYSRFARNLNGLVNGDLQLKTLPPPTVDIKLQFMQAETRWRMFKTTVEHAAEGGRVDARVIAVVAEQTMPLYEEMETAADMLEDF